MKSAEATKVPTGVPGAERGRMKDDEAPPVPPPPKTGLLDTSLSRSIVIATMLICLVWATVGLLGARYSLVALPRTENSYIYRIDHLTGAVSFCTQGACLPLPMKANNEGE